MTQVNNSPDETFDNLFARQQAILSYLATVGQPQGSHIGHLPRTGDVVKALGLPNDKISFASVSRSLARLCKAGKVDAYFPQRCLRGKGAYYCLATSNKK